jgi:two-component system phosphate regulon sensor histidine kinase PhoR
MKRALIKKNILMMLLAFGLFFFVAMLTLIYLEKQNRTSVMTSVLDEVTLEYTHFEGTPPEFVQLFQVENGRRITLLDPDGLVIADSHDELVGTDKSLRPEIVSLGKVYARESETIGIDLYYIARIMEDGNYLRVSLPIANQSALYRRVTLSFIFTSIAFLGIYYLGLIQVNKHLLSPWEKVIRGLSALSEGNYQRIELDSPYPEINELLSQINLINYETKNYVRRIESYQTQQNEILNGLKQGVMLFDDSETLIYFNDDAQTIFSLTEDALMKPSYYSLRDNQIKDAIRLANQSHQGTAFDYHQEGKTIEVKVFPIDGQGIEHSHATVLALLRDVTKERATEQIKKDFFSHASHELKSPLTAIRGLAELIENHLIPDQDVGDTAHKIVLQTDNMTHLVEDMLMLSRLENLKEKSDVSVNLAHLLGEVIDQLAPLIQTKHMDVSVDSTDVVLMCDPVDLHKLFKNLLENALKYSDEHKKVHAILSQESDQIIFTVIDQGYGISPEHQQRIFERFYRIDKGRLDGGTGLGLAIVKHIVLKYGGSIDLKSSLSKGTTMTIRLKRS